MTLLLGMANGKPMPFFMTLVLGVATDQQDCFDGVNVGIGPWAHVMALGPLGGPVMRAQPKVILVTLVLGVANGQPNFIIMILVLGVTTDQPNIFS